MEIQYDVLQSEIANLLGDHKIMVLATAVGDCVTARSMSCIICGLDVLFQTDVNYVKSGQIRANPNVALCWNNLQIEGRAEITGNMKEERNRDFIEKFKTHYEGSYRAYSHLPTEIVIRVRPTKMTLWKYDEGKPYRDFLLVSEDRACREYIQTMEPSGQE